MRDLLQTKRLFGILIEILIVGSSASRRLNNLDSKQIKTASKCTVGRSKWMFVAKKLRIAASRAQEQDCKRNAVQSHAFPLCC